MLLDKKIKELHDSFELDLKSDASNNKDLYDSLYSKYLSMVFSDNLVNYNSDTQSISGFFPGTEYVSPVIGCSIFSYMSFILIYNKYTK